jgi:hypothetical protein
MGKVIGIALICLLSSEICFAAWSSAGEISRLRIYNGNIVLSSLSSLSADYNLTSCGNTSNSGQFSFSLNQQNSNALLSMLMSAELAGRKVQVYLTGSCVENRPEINGVQIVDQ